MIRSNTDCPYCHDIFDQYCNLFKGYKNCAKSDCEVLKILKKNEQLKQQIKDLESQLKDVIEDNDYYQKENEKMKCCFNCDKPIKHLDCVDCHNGSNWELAQSDRLIRN